MTSATRLLSQMPEHLVERVEILADRPLPRSGRFVLYWMHHAMRGHENPALDTAILAARAHDLPLLVYQGFSGRHAYSNDRHLMFALEGARDVEAELAARGIPYAFHLPAHPAERAPLRTLAQQAAILVTEDFPVLPFRQWTRFFARMTKALVLQVDTACLVPMRLVGRPYERVLEFRDAMAQERSRRIARTWPEIEPVGTLRAPSLPFRRIELARADFAELMAGCDIDHQVGPIPHTRGGSRAGYERWEKFRERGLHHYAEQRNDPTLDGVSRLSPYLHYGMVSPLRIAREAAADGSPGAEKYLDALLVWRELAYSFCRFRPDHDTVMAIPAWARQTLLEHEKDPRPLLPAWETLARGRTGDELWDPAQKSLLVHGELHHSVRKTWGKTLLGWTRSATDALALLFDLNHRYALDGSDPGSFGGMLWCLGQFDHPCEPPQPVLGRVRPRPTSEHAGRFDMDLYRRRVLLSPRGKLRVAVIGAGMAGLTAARTLADHQVEVAVFDEGSGPGGRASTQRAAPWTFDHGAPCFTVRDERFRRYVHSWREQGLVAPWDGRIVELRAGHASPSSEPAARFTGIPGMSAIGEHLAREVGARYGCRVARVEREGLGWRLVDGGGEQLGSFDVVLLAVPAPQAATLLAEARALAEQAARAVIHPCFAVMVGFGEGLRLPFNGAFVKGSPLSWVARDSSKPGRTLPSGGESWVLQTTPEWSMLHLDEAPEAVVAPLLDAFREAVGVDVPTVAHAVAHRWRHALTGQPLGKPCLWDASLRIGACGDWCLGARLENAFLSGAAIAGRVLSLPAPRP
ncbi:MAG: FAD-dependent oxidoreductase [Planctomycetota bacterium]